MKRIPLSGARVAEGPRAFALVDDDDYDALVSHGAWSLRVSRSHRYAIRSERGEDGRSHQVAMHRLLLGLEFGDVRQVDHVDLNGLNNQRSNLRLVTQAENLQNKSSRPGSTSRFRNVNWAYRRARWQVTVHEAGKSRTLGYYRHEIEAALAAQAWRDQHMPFALPDPALTDYLDGIVADLLADDSAAAA